MFKGFCILIFATHIGVNLIMKIQNFLLLSKLQTMFLKTIEPRIFLQNHLFKFRSTENENFLTTLTQRQLH